MAGRSHQMMIICDRHSDRLWGFKPTRSVKSDLASWDYYANRHSSKNKSTTTTATQFCEYYRCPTFIMPLYIEPDKWNRSFHACIIPDQLISLSKFYACLFIIINTLCSTLRLFSSWDLNLKAILFRCFKIFEWQIFIYYVCVYEDHVLNTFIDVL